MMVACKYCGKSFDHKTTVHLCSKAAEALYQECRPYSVHREKGCLTITGPGVVWVLPEPPYDDATAESIARNMGDAYLAGVEEGLNMPSDHLSDRN